VLNIAQHVHSAAPGHTDVQDEQGGSRFLQMAEDFIAAAGFGEECAGQGV